MFVIIVSSSSSVVHKRALLCSENSIDQFVGNILVDSIRGAMPRLTL